MNTTENGNRRTSNKWTALVLLLIAAMFFIGVIANHWYLR